MLGCSGNTGNKSWLEHSKLEGEAVVGGGPLGELGSHCWSLSKVGTWCHFQVKKVTDMGVGEGRHKKISHCHPPGERPG